MIERIDRSRSPECAPDRSGRIQVNEPKFDLASNAELQKGLVLLSHCRGARGIGVQPFRAATVCEFEPASETDPGHAIWLRPWIAKLHELGVDQTDAVRQPFAAGNIFGETTRRASRTCASRMPASPVLRILDPRLALATFAANSDWRHTNSHATARTIKTRHSPRNRRPTKPHPTATKALDREGPM